MTSTKIRCAIVSSSEEVSAALAREVESCYSIVLTHRASGYPDETALTRLLRFAAPDIVIMDCQDSALSLAVIAQIQGRAPNTAIVAYCQEETAMLLALMRAGVRDHIPRPLDRSTCHAALQRVVEKIQKRPAGIRTGGDIVSFLPAKPGVGASIIASNTSLAASRLEGAKTLLADFDLGAGIASFLFRLRPELTLKDALSHAYDMDGDLWAKMRSQSGSLDILPSDFDGLGPPDLDRIARLLEFFRNTYDLTCLDLSGHLDAASVEALLASKKIYLVCTQELASQHILRKKVEHLKRLGLENEVRIIINRFQPSHVLNRERIEQLAELKVELTIPNNYKLASQSFENGLQIDPKTDLGASFNQLAHLLLDRKTPVPSTKRRFLEYVFVHSPETRT